jgi:thiol-disulfide isomerase/thioredoxin
MKRLLLGIVVSICSPALAADSSGPDRAGPIDRGPEAAARSLLGTLAPPFPSLPWVDGQRRDSGTFAGKVVVIRNFTDGCPFCVTTLPALEQIHRDYRKRGLQVLGVYHPKPPRAVSLAEARGHAQALGATFPVAVDARWALVESWWLSVPGARWTSVTWVLDRAGRLRFVHPGGEYHRAGGADHGQCRADELQLRATLDRLLD